MLENVEIVTTCMGRLAHLKQTLPLMMKHAHVTVVDWSCPEKTCQWVFDTYGINGVYAISYPGERYFHHAKARNFGANYFHERGSGKEWICFLDADRIVSDDFGMHLRDVLKPGVYVAHPEVEKNFNGIIVCRYEDWKKVGGWPVLQRSAYGMEDGAFMSLLSYEGLKQVSIPKHCIDHIEHNEDLRTINTEYHGRIAEGHGYNLMDYDQQLTEIRRQKGIK